MGFIKNGFVFSLGVLLLLSFLAMNVFLTLSLSLKYDNVKQQLEGVEGGVIQESINQDVVIVIGNEEDNLDNETSNNLDEAYYKNYDCGFWNCFEQQGEDSVFFLISKKAHDYWQNKFYLFLFVSFVLMVVMFFFVSPKENLLLYYGALLFISALPFAKAELILSRVLEV